MATLLGSSAKAEASSGSATTSPQGLDKALPPGVCKGSAQPSPSYLLRLQVFRMSFLLRNGPAPVHVKVLFNLALAQGALQRSKLAPGPTLLLLAPNQRLFTQFEVSP